MILVWFIFICPCLSNIDIYMKTIDNCVIYAFKIHT